MINSINQAFRIIETQTEGIPYEAIEYLRNERASQVITNKIVYALNHAYDGTFFDEDQDYEVPVPLWYSIVGETHLSEELIEPTIQLFLTDDDWDFLNEQAHNLLGLLAEKYQEKVIDRVIEVIDALIVLKSKLPYLYLFDVFFFADKEKYKGWFLKSLQNPDLYWKEPFAVDMAELQIKEALPYLKNMYKKMSEFGKVDIKEAIEELETGILKYPEQAKAYCKQRESWKEHYKRFENRFFSDYEEIIKDENQNLDLNTETSFHTSKIGRNDICPCGSGKKYKKCCLLKLN